MKKGLIFDMDGTLWDSSLNVAKSWNIAAENCGYKREEITKEEIMAVMGKTMDVIADIIFEKFTKEECKEILENCCIVENNYLKENGGELYPNLEETFKTLQKDYHLYIVSNCQAGYIEAFLDHYKFHNYFEDIECFGNNGKSKGENIALVVKRNNLDKAYYIGDIQGDYDATMEAGIDFIHAKYGFGVINAIVPELEAFDQLPSLLEKI